MSFLHRLYPFFKINKQDSFSTDECGRCSGGTTGRVFHKRDCARKCFANGTQSENVVDACGRCQKRSFLGKDARDCNGDCVFGRSRACINKCGICVGGRTGKPHNQGEHFSFHQNIINYVGIIMH